MANSGLTSLNPNPQMSTPTPQGIKATYAGMARPATQPAQQTTQPVDMTGVPASAVAALSTSGLSGNDLTNAQAALKSHYAQTQPTTQTPTQPTTQNSQANIQTPQTPTQTPPQTTFGGLVGSATTTAQTTPAATTQAQTGLLGTAATNPGTSGQAYQDYQSAINDLNTLKSQYATAVAGLGGAGLPFAVRQGQEAALQQQYNDQLDAAQNKVNEKAAALGYQIQGTTAQQTGLQEAGQLGVSEQQTALGGLGTAISAAKPEQSYPFVFDPTTGTYTNASTGGTLSDGDAAQAVMSGKLTYQQAISSLPGGAAESRLNQAIISAGGNPESLQAQGAATQSNIETAGTAETGAAGQAYGQYYGQALSVGTALNQVQSLGNLTLQTAQGGNINPFTIAAGNATLADLKRQLSSPSQGQFDQTMATFQGALSQLFAGSSDVTPTQISTWSTQISNGTMPVATLQAIYQQSLKEGNLKLSNIQATGGAAFSQLQNSATPSTGGGTVQTKYGAINTNW